MRIKAQSCALSSSSTEFKHFKLMLVPNELLVLITHYEQNFNQNLTK
jgi:hypothetical protein